MVKTDSYNNNSKNVKLQKISKGVVNKGAWTADEDRRLSEYIKINGDKKWRSLPARAGLNRCGKSCRLRWLNYLRPDIKRGNISEDEEDLIMRLHNLLGNRWSLIAGRLPGRTDNEIKNYWNTHLSKKSLSISDLNKKIIRRKKHHVSSEPAAIHPAPSEPDASKGKSCGPSLRPWSDVLEKDLDVDMNIDLDGFFDFPDFVSNGTEPDSNDKGLENPLGESSSEGMYQRMMGPELGNTGDQGCDYQSKFDILDFDMLSRFLDSDMDGGLQIPDQNVSN